MHKSVFLFLVLAFCALLTQAIEFKNKDHSNYGDSKQNKEHIREHLRKLSASSGEEPQDLSDEDMIYYLFLIHDLNGDGFLDGHELRAAFTDFGDEHEDVTHYFSLEEVTDMVDHVLEEDDLNGDGLISWSEYLESQNYHHAEVVLH